MSATYRLVPIEWLRAHEQYVEARVQELLQRFTKTGCVDYAVVADAATGTVIDGHHRLEALRRSGARLVPVNLVDYAHPSLTVANWRPDEPPVTKEEVLQRAREGRLFPPKTTKHDFVRVLDPVDVPLKMLQEPQAGHLSVR
jgi:L-serine kinase (ADP)